MLIVGDRRLTVSWFFTGLLVGVYTPQLVSVMLPYALCALTILAASMIALRAWRTVLGLVVGVLLQLSATQSALDARLSPDLEGDSLVVRCTVTDIPRIDELSARFDAACTGPVALPERIRLGWYQPLASVRTGDHWQFVVRLRAPGGALNPGRRDADVQALAGRLGATGYVVSSSRNRLLSVRTAPIADLRQAIRARIHEVLPDRSSAAVVVALATGIRHDMTREQWRRFAASGTNHLVAISGLHIGLVAAIVVLLGRPLLACVLRAASARRTSYFLGLLAALLFGLLSGWGVPAQRACLMLSAVVFASLARRETGGWSMLAVAGSLVLVSDSLASLSVGFMLSFTAVAVLLWLFAPLRLSPGEPQFRLSGVRRLPVLQVGLFFGLLPIIVLSGQAASLSAPLVNLVAVPLFSVVTVPATLLGVLLIPMEQDALWFRIAGLSVDGFDALLDNAAFVPAIRAGLWLSLPAILWVLLPAGFPGRVVALLVLPAMLLSSGRTVPNACFDSHFLDVGQGTAILVETRTHRLLYDTGPAYRSGTTAAALYVLPFMRQRRIQHIDTLIVSHADLDHAGGLSDVLDGLTPTRVYAGEVLSAIRATPCHAGQAWTHDGIRFRFIYPDRPFALDGNNASCVLEVSAGNQRLLLTGDIEREAERFLLKGELQSAAVVSVPHHGSRTSSTPPFVQALDARFAIVSAAATNRWGLPLPDVVARWEAAGSQIVHLGRAGYTRLRICAHSGAELVHIQRERQRRWWQEPNAG